jgi:hypothetical protein
MPAAGPSPDGLLDRVQDELGVHAGRRSPTQDAAGVGVDDERDVDRSGPRRHVRVRSGRSAVPVFRLDRS